jgi:hypothetical protein
MHALGCSSAGAIGSHDGLSLGSSVAAYEEQGRTCVSVKESYHRTNTPSSSTFNGLTTAFSGRAVGDL